MTTAPLRVALYSHDAKGLGHLRRNLALAHHLARALPGLTGRNVTGLVITGLAPGQEHRLPDGFDWLVLPGVKKAKGVYLPQRLRIAREDLGLVRSALLSGVLTTFTPDLLIIDRHPYGVHQELREPLARLRQASPRARVVLGLREVLDTPVTVQREWEELGEADTLRRLIDEVWVYGDDSVHDLSATGEAPTALEERMRYTGYLAHGRDAAEATHGSEASEALAGNAEAAGTFILTTAGGGSDGVNLLRTAAAARVPDGYRHVVVTGPQLDAALFHQVAQTAGPRTIVRRSWPGMSHHIQQAAAVISMGGYNTVSEILASDTPALLVPRETPRLEQLIRATALKHAGAIELLRVTDLSTAALEDWLTERLSDQDAGTRSQLAGRRRLRLDGLETVPLLAAELVGEQGRRPRHPPQPSQQPHHQPHQDGDPRMNPAVDNHQDIHQNGTRIGYVLKVYPRFSETFIVTEVLAREAQGEDLSIYALRPTTDSRFHPEIARVAARVNWVSRPVRAIDLWSRLTDGLTRQDDRERFAAIMPVLADLPGDEVAQGVELARQARRDSITHLHAHFASLAGRVAWIASALTGIPYTVTTHAKDIFHESVDPVWLRRICADAQRVIAISRYNEAHLGKVLAGTGATVSLRYNAIELDRFSYRAPQPVASGRSGPLRVCAVGRLVPKKGFADLIEAVRILVSSGVDVEVGLAGDGEERERLTAQIDRLGLAGRVRLLGPLTQAEVRGLLAHSDVFAAPCIEAADGNIDGLPTVVLEAMACGTPVVATAVSGLPEVVHDGVTGLLLPPGDPAELAVALRGIALGEVDTVSLSRGARRLIEEHFDSRAQAEVLAAWQSGPRPAPVAPTVHPTDQEGAA